MAVYTVRKASGVIAPDSGTTMFLSVIPAATRSVRCQEFSFSGLGVATAANEFQIALSPAGTTPGGALTPYPFSPLSQVAAGFTTATTYATAPVLNAQAGLAIGVNANGGTYRWLAKTNFELITTAGITNAANLNFKVISGVSTIAFSTILEEI